jgi:hypothetical protein
MLEGSLPNVSERGRWVVSSDDELVEVSGSSGRSELKKSSSPLILCQGEKTSVSSNFASVPRARTDPPHSPNADQTPHPISRTLLNPKRSLSHVLRQKILALPLPDHLLSQFPSLEDFLGIETFSVGYRGLEDGSVDRGGGLVVEEVGHDILTAGG